VIAQQGVLREQFEELGLDVSDFPLVDLDGSALLHLQMKLSGLQGVPRPGTWLPDPERDVCVEMHQIRVDVALHGEQMPEIFVMARSHPFQFFTPERDLQFQERG